ncbi:hypothetical protein [Amycolatopsis albispora]|uniref:Uncharacterized protein n=1 Tax=Amycolatopsis albispora TaxID=1804986 RepID=A0A344L825_9PSEU|nr:hypothetical protein [Amycolatopsis albispora]AXB44199.1 hypothetical protein A4R43_18100 [Amycolatopsis albispora]
MRLVRLAQQPSRVADDIRAALASLGRGNTVVGGVALIGVSPPGFAQPVDAVVLLPRGVLIVVGVDLPDPAMRLDAPLTGQWKADGWPLVGTDEAVNPATDALATSEKIARHLRETEPSTTAIGTIVAVGPYVEQVDQPPADLAGSVRVLHPTPTAMLAAAVSLASATQPSTVAQARAMLAALAENAPKLSDDVLTAEGFAPTGLAEPERTEPVENPLSAIPPTVPADHPPSKAKVVRTAPRTPPVAVAHVRPPGQAGQPAVQAGQAPQKAAAQAAQTPQKAPGQAQQLAASQPPQAGQATQGAAAQAPQLATGQAQQAVQPQQAGAGQAPQTAAGQAVAGQAPLAGAGQAQQIGAAQLPQGVTGQPQAQLAGQRSPAGVQAGQPGQGGQQRAAVQAPRQPGASPQPKQVRKPLKLPKLVKDGKPVRWLPYAAVGLLLVLLVAAISVAASQDGGETAAPQQGPTQTTTAAPTGQNVDGMGFNQLAAESGTQCTPHAFGDTKTVLETTPCSRLRRASFEVAVDGRRAAVTLAALDFPSQEQAETFKQFVDFPGNGGITDLAVETGKWPGQPPTFSGAAYASTGAQTSVLVAQACWLDGPSTSDDPGLGKAAKAGLTMPLPG